jgi:hypothetical protein
MKTTFIYENKVFGNYSNKLNKEDVKKQIIKDTVSLDKRLRLKEKEDDINYAVGKLVSLMSTWDSMKTDSAFHQIINLNEDAESYPWGDSTPTEYNVKCKTLIEGNNVVVLLPVKFPTDLLVITNYDDISDTLTRQLNKNCLDLIENIGEKFILKRYPVNINEKIDTVRFLHCSKTHIKEFIDSFYFDEKIKCARLSLAWTFTHTKDFSELEDLSNYLEADNVIQCSVSKEAVNVDGLKNILSPKSTHQIQITFDNSRATSVYEPGKRNLGAHNVTDEFIQNVFGITYEQAFDKAKEKQKNSLTGYHNDAYLTLSQVTFTYENPADAEFRLTSS